MLVIFIVDNERAAMHSEKFFIQSPTRPGSGTSIGWLDMAKWAVELTCRSLLTRRQSVDRSLAQLQFSLFLTSPLASSNNHNNHNNNTNSNSSGCFAGSTGLGVASNLGAGLPRSQLMSVDDFLQLVKSLPSHSSFSTNNNGGGMGRCLTEVFEYIHALQYSRYDTAQQAAGMWIPLSDPVIIMCISCEGLAVRSLNNGGTSLTVEGLRVPGSELYLEPFRWNQRLFCLELAHPSSSKNINGNGEEGILYWLDKMMRVMAGGWKRVTSVREMKPVIEYWCSNLPSQPAQPPQMLIKDVQQMDPVEAASFFPSGVVVSFSSVVTDKQQPPLFREHLCLIQTDPIESQFVDRNTATVMTKGGWLSLIPDYSKLFGFWPIPESACSPAPPDTTSNGQPAPNPGQPIPRRFSQPHLCVWPNESGIDYSSRVPDGIVLKKYLINPHSECARFIMQAENRTKIWLVSSAPHPATGSPVLPLKTSAPGLKSTMNEPPFALLKLNSVGNGVNMWLLPYNFPELFAIIYEWQRTRGQLSEEWKRRYEMYFSALPQYYFGVTRRLLKVKCQPPFPVPRDKVPAQLAKDDRSLAHARLISEMALTHSVSYSVPPSLSSFLSHGAVKHGVLYEKVAGNAFNVDSIDLVQQHYIRLRLFGDAVPSSLAELSKSGLVDKNASPSKFGFPLFGYSGSQQEPLFNSVADIIENWNIPEVKRRDFGNRLAPRNPSQAVEDSKHRFSIAKMGDYKPRLQVRRFLTDEEEKRDVLVAFGNPYKRGPKSPPPARVQQLGEPSENPQAPSNLQGIEETVEQEQFITSAQVSPPKHAHKAGKLHIESISEKRPSAKFKISIDPFSKPFDPNFVKSIDTRRKFVGEVRQKAFDLDQTLQRSSSEATIPSSPILPQSFVSAKRWSSDLDFISPKKKKAVISPWLDEMQLSEAIMSDDDSFEIISSESSLPSVRNANSASEVVILDSDSDEDEVEVISVSQPSVPVSRAIPFEAVQKHVISLIRRAGTSNNNEIINQITRPDLLSAERRQLRDLAISECRKFKKTILLRLLENVYN